MGYTKDELQRKFFSGDYSGLNLGSLVRLSFEKDYGKHEKATVVLSGADINGRDDQEDRCRRAVEAMGAKYVYTYDEPNTSAWKRRKVRVVINDEETFVWRVVRPVYEGALKDLKRGIAPNGERLDGLIVYDLDRLTRDLQNLLDAIDVVEHHGRLITDINRTLDLFTETGRSNAKFLVTAKGMSSSDTSRRITDKHQAIAMAGIPVGGSRPFGWNDDKRTLHPVESELLRKARLDILAGVGQHTICREWNEAGITTPRGKTWVRTVLRNILLSPRLAGYRVYREDICYDHDGNPVMGQYEPIFTIPEWEELRDYLTREQKNKQDVHRGGLKYLLSGIVRCALCGATCRAYRDLRNNVHYYACPPPTSSRGCGKVAINGVKLDAMITQELHAKLATTEVKHAPLPWPHESMLTAKENKIAELMAAYNSDELPKEYVFPTVAKINGEVNMLKRDRAAWNRNQVRAQAASGNIIELWPTLTIDRKRAAVENVIHTIVLGKRTIKQTRFDPDRISIVWRDVTTAELSARLAVISADSAHLQNQ